MILRLELLIVITSQAVPLDMTVLQFISVIVEVSIWLISGTVEDGLMEVSKCLIGILVQLSLSCCNMF